MERIEVTDTLLKDYFSGRKRHAGYKSTCQMYHELKVHADGEYPKELIEERRPSESDHIQEYRKKIYQSVTKDPVKRVFSSLTKINRSVDWYVSHPVDKYPSRIPESERLDQYTEKHLPIYGNFEHWLFSILLKNYLLDANAVVLVKPYSLGEEENEFFKPVPVVYNSPCVVEFIPNELVILRLDDQDNVSYNVLNQVAGKKFLVATTEFIQYWEAKGRGWTMTSEYEHGLGVLPAFQTAGDYFKTLDNTILFESRISPMLPRLNDAAREYSDLQAEVVQHIHSEKWTWATDKCPTCRDKSGTPTGFINDPRREGKITCPTCKGNLTVASSPYLNTVIRPQNTGINETQTPIPPSGYITKPTDIVRIQDERVDKHIYKALSSLNMQFLDQSPMNQSGKAKEVDKDELNNFVYGVAKDLVRIARNAMKLMVDYRYKDIVLDPALRNELLPEIKVPQKFDLLSSNYLAEELKFVKESKVNPVIVGQLEREYANKKFYSDSGVRETVTATLELDPLAGITDEDKMIRLSNGGITRLDYVVSSNINAIVNEAMQDGRFITLSLADKKRIIQDLAQAKLNELNALRTPLNNAD